MRVKTKKILGKIPTVVFKKTGIVAGVSLVIVSAAVYIFVFNGLKAEAAVKINDVSDFGTLPTSGKYIVRTSSGTIYAFLSSGTTCQIWKSSDGVSWSQQDSVNSPTCSSEQGAAIDSSGVISLLYQDSYVMKYTSFSTSSDTFSGTVQIFDGDGTSNYTFTSAGVVTDTNNRAHVAYLMGYQDIVNHTETWYLNYVNNVGGTWNSIRQISSAQSVAMNAYDDLSITMDEDNLPEISFVDDIGSLTVCIASANSSFPSFTCANPASGLAQGSSTSIAVDGRGNTFVAYEDYNTAKLVIVKHNDADAWATWQTPVSSSYDGTSISLVVRGGLIYAVYVNSGNSVAYQTYGGAWSGETILNSSAIFYQANAKWSFLNNNSEPTLDYLFSDQTDVYYGSLTIDYPPDGPLVDYPYDGATNVPISPAFQMEGQDYSSDYEQFEILIYQSDCTTLVRDINQTSSQTGWSGQDAATGTAYWENTVANYDYQSPPLAYGTTYCLKARGIDPGGSNTWGAYTSAMFTTTSPPSAPTLLSPTSGATGTSTSPLFQLRSTDPEGDYIRYKIIVYNSDCSTGAQTFDQTFSQTGWAFQDQQNGTAYTGSPTLTSSTIAKYGLANLSPNTTYCWKAAGIDPGGSNIWSSYSPTQLFTTGAANSQTIKIQGGASVTGGSYVR